MCVWFCICVVAVIAVLPFYFVSVEHLKLQERFGLKKGKRFGEICGLVSGWGFFIFRIGIWISPQPRFIILFPQDWSIVVPAVSFSIPLLHLMISMPFLMLGAWFGINGVKEVTLRVAETHRTDRIISTGVYSIIRHPQYLGALLAHFGISFLLSAWFSLLSTPLMIILICLISRKEEKELTREFGQEYKDYRKKVPMLMPKPKCAMSMNRGTRNFD